MGSDAKHSQDLSPHRLNFQQSGHELTDCEDARLRNRLRHVRAEEPEESHGSQATGVQHSRLSSGVMPR